MSAPAAAPNFSTLAAVPAPDVGRLMASLRRWGLGVLAAWLIMATLWVVFAPISGAVVGGGLVKVDANRQTVSHRDGGIVAKVLVREGQLVKKGEPLILLEDARVDSTVDLLRAQLVAERLRRSRLEAEANHAAAWSAPALDKAVAASARTREALGRERAAFDARRRTLLGQLESVRLQIADTAIEIKAHQANSAASTEGLRLLRDEITSNEALLAENFVNRVRVLALQRGVSEYESRIQAADAEAAKARQRRTELEGRLAQVKDAYAQAASEELREATARMVDLEERLRAGQDTAGRQAVVSPADGRLVDLRVNTVGSAIGAREPIVDVVPTDAVLVVEARIGADAAGEVRVGQAADVKLMAAKRRDTALLKGRVSQVSADALLEPRSGAPYFAVQVEVPADAAQTLGMPVTPGMAAEVYIRIVERTPLDFLLDPLTSSMRRGFREH